MSVINLDNKKFPMTIITNLETGASVSDTSNTFNNFVDSVYNVNLHGYHKIRITRFEIMDIVSAPHYAPLLLSLISPVFLSNKGNYPYPIMVVPNNIKTDPLELQLGMSTVSLGDNGYYIFNFNGVFPLWIADLYDGYTNQGTFFDPQNVGHTALAVLTMEVERM